VHRATATPVAAKKKASAGAGARSMTGYGAGRASGPRIAVEVEIRSVNHRGLKVSWRLPPSLTARESEFEGLVRKRVRRGSLAVFLRLTYVRPEDVARVRDDVVAGYAAALDRLRRQRLVDGPLTPEALASLPGALETGTDAPLRPADLKVVRRALEDALSNLDAMRRREATHLVRDLRALARRMDKERTAIARRAPRVVKEHRDRLKERLDQLLASTGHTLDEATLAREAAVIADRADVTEELTRLAAHVDEIGAYLDRGEGVGRTLEFLGQELLREANTIGSKSSDVALARSVIALKSEIDRFKEQVANLE